MGAVVQDGAPSENVAVGRIRFDAVALLFLWPSTSTTGSAGAQVPSWTDDPLLPGVTPIRAVHFTELRTRINELLTGCGGTAFAFTDATLKAGETPVRAVHVIELRAALGRAYDACGGSRPTWSDPSPVRGSAIRARHLTELRDATGVLSARSPSLESYYAYIPLNVVDPSYPPQGSFNASADLNGDGNEDLIILGTDYPDGQSTSYSPQPGRVLLGDGDGGFALAPSELYPVDTLNTVHPRSVPFGDLNGDGGLDMFVAAHGWDADPFPGEQNRLYLSLPGGGWRDATDELPQVSDFTHSAAIGDVRGRGILDIIVGTSYGGMPYALLNNGDGSFVLNRTILPVGPGETMDAYTSHNCPGTVLTDLDDNGLPELIVTADRSSPDNGNHNSSVLWNRSGAFREQDKTVLPMPAPFAETHIDLDAASIDADGDSMLDLIVVGTQGDPFYDWGAPSLLGHGLRENPMSPGGGGMVRSRQVKGAGSAPTEGARRATGVGADAAAMGSGALAPGQRWSASRKRDVVLRLLRSEPLDAVSREVGVEVYRLERWKVRALAGLERGLKEQAGEPLAAELDAAKRHIGELSMDNELLRSRARAAERRLPLATRRSRR